MGGSPATILPRANECNDSIIMPAPTGISRQLRFLKGDGLGQQSTKQHEICNRFPHFGYTSKSRPRGPNMSYRAFTPLVFATLCLGVGFSQTSNKPSTSDQRQTIRVGIAATMNRSNRQIIPTWERDQLVREMQRLRSDHKSMIVLEAVSLEATAREDAGPEAEEKGCQYFVLTTLLNPSRGPGISGGPDGSQRAPILLGNTPPNKALAVNFTLVEAGTGRTLAEGTATTPVEGNNDIRAADDSMRFVAHRVASELRSTRPPTID